MKVGGTTNTQPKAQSPQVAEKTVEKGSFQQVLESVKAKGYDAFLDFQKSTKDLTRMQSQLDGNHKFGAKELLKMQIQVSQLNLRVEMLSKAADSALAISRKLQSTQ